MSFFSTTFHANSGISLVALNREWLLAGLKNAGRTAGSETWWLLDDVATAIWTALQRENLQTSLSLGAFDELVKAVLCDIGYRDVATAFQSDHPRQQVSLLACSQNPPLRSKRDFFARLRSTIQTLHRRGIQDIHLTDLSSCEAELLSGGEMFAWPAPSFEKAQVVKFVRQEIRFLYFPQPIRCLIS